jgi:hypothetical protein
MNLTHHVPEMLRKRVSVELKSNKGQNAKQHVFSLEETAHFLTMLSITEHWQLTDGHIARVAGKCAA